MSEMGNSQDGVLGQQSNKHLKITAERYTSDRLSALDPSDSNTLISSGEDRANGTPEVSQMHRFGHLAQPTTNPPYQSPYLSQPSPKGPSRSTKEVIMSYEGVDLTAEGNHGPFGVSWHDPHPIFVILLVGPEEIPFGIQKDLLCAQSPFYHDGFAQSQNDKVEYVVRLPNTDVHAFGCFQNFIYTGDVYDKRGGVMVPDYPILMGVWKLATHLLMSSLRVAVLDAMAERRQLTGFIPSSELLVEAWKQTEDRSGLRKMLIEWAAEHMRSNPEERSAFIRSLPKEILSALVIALSDIPSGPSNLAIDLHHSVKHPLPDYPEETEVRQAQVKNKRARKSATDPVNSAQDEVFEVKATVKKPARKSEPSRRTNKRVSAPAIIVDNDPTFTEEKEMEYCRELIKRMVSGPGYWTRYVSNFRKPVDPVHDNAPNYFDVVKKPMCLNMMKTKMDKGEYSNAAQFEADVRLIFQNCYEYWTPVDQIWKECEIFEEFFNSQWAQRSKYGVGKKVKTETMN